MINTINQKMTAIANAIRNKTGKTGNLTVDQMPTEIEAIETGIDTSDATATANQILSGATAYVNGEKITGAISSKTAATYTPSTSTQTISAGQYLSGAQTINPISLYDYGATEILSGEIKTFNIPENYNGLNNFSVSAVKTYLDNEAGDTTEITVPTHSFVVSYADLVDDNDNPLPLSKIKGILIYISGYYFTYDEIMDLDYGGVVSMFIPNTGSNFQSGYCETMHINYNSTMDQLYFINTHERYTLSQSKTVQMTIDETNKTITVNFANANKKCLFMGETYEPDVATYKVMFYIDDPTILE